jgi:regulator of sigma E protease
MTFLISALGAALGIGLLIFVHEFGHYLAARFAGIRVEVFSLGFGPRLLGFQLGDTDYRLSAVPLGGYVRVAGEDPIERRGLAADELYAKGHLARAAFFAGGVVMNVLFALVAFPLVFGLGVSFPAPVVGGVEAGGPAWRAGLLPDDRVVEVAGKAMYSYENLIVEIALAGGRGPIELTIEREGQRRSVLVEPVYEKESGIYEIGISAPYRLDAPRIEDVASSGPAAAAGLRSGDRLLAIDGRLVSGTTRAELLEGIRPNDSLELELLRGDERITTRLSAGRAAARPPQLGILAIRPRVAALREAAAITQLGLRVGDRVLAIDGVPYAGQVLVPASRGPGPIRLLAHRDGRVIELASTLDAAGVTALNRDVAMDAPSGDIVVAPRPGSPAEAAGVLAGDLVRRVDDRPVHDWNELLSAVRAAGERKLTLVVDRLATDGALSRHDLALSAAPVVDADLGFAATFDPRTERIRATDFGDAMRLGFVASSDMVKQIYVTLKRLVTGDVSARNLSGIVGISVVSYRSAQRGWIELLWLLAALSLNLAIVNLLPIPLLDGGHLLFLAIERVRGAPVSARVMNYSQVVGLVFVLALVVFVTFNDIRRIFFS